MKTIYIGNLPFNSTEDEVRDFFQTHGEVHSVRIITDRETGRSRGFAFIEMDDENADTVIDTLNGTDFNGRTLRINEARNKNDRPPRRY